MSKTLLVSLVLFGTLACTPIDPSRFGIGPSDSATTTRLNEIARTPDTLSEFFGGTTSKFYNPEFGTQIEYLAPDGTAYVANSAIEGVATGDWLTAESPFLGAPADICLRYEADVFEITGPLGEGLQCRPGRLYAYVKDEVVRGDPLGLSSGDVAMSDILLSGDDVSLAEAFRALGKGRFRASNRVTWDWRLAEPVSEGSVPPS